MKKDTLLVIPARYASTRFPAKVLAPLSGKPVLQWVYEACLRADVGAVLIATEHKAVVEAAAKFGAKAILTSESCASGTDRIYQASHGRREKYIVNVQSDEPFLEPSTLKAVLKKLSADKNADIATAGARITDSKEILDPNCVKIAMNKQGRALYFSRSPIPYHHELSPDCKTAPWYKHCGLYAYKRAALDKFVKLPPSPLERLERLEQLRALEAGMAISCVEVPRLGPAIDVPSDIRKALAYLKKHRSVGNA